MSATSSSIATEPCCATESRQTIDMLRMHPCRASTRADAAAIGSSPTIAAALAPSPPAPPSSPSTSDSAIADPCSPVTLWVSSAPAVPSLSIVAGEPWGTTTSATVRASATPPAMNHTGLRTVPSDRAIAELSICRIACATLSRLSHALTATARRIGKRSTRVEKNVAHGPRRVDQTVPPSAASSCLPLSIDESIDDSSDDSSEPPTAARPPSAFSPAVVIAATIAPTIARVLTRSPPSGRLCGRGKARGSGSATSYKCSASTRPKPSGNPARSHSLSHATIEALSACGQ